MCVHIPGHWGGYSRPSLVLFYGFLYLFIQTPVIIFTLEILQFLIQVVLTIAVHWACLLLLDCPFSAGSIGPKASKEDKQACNSCRYQCSATHRREVLPRPWITHLVFLSL